MKEDLLRGMIRKQIKSSLKEAPMASTRVEKGLGRIEKMAGVKMLKKALGQGSITQQASGLLAVVKAISGNNPIVAKTLARMIQKQGIGTDMGGDASSMGEAKVAASLKSRQDKVDKTQAMKMMKAALTTKSSVQQSDFVTDFINNLDLKDQAKKRLVLQLRKNLK